MLGFRASVTLEDGIAEIVEAVRQGKITDWKHPIYSNLKQMEGPVMKALSDEGEPESTPLTETQRFLRDAA